MTIKLGDLDSNVIIHTLLAEARAAQVMAEPGSKEFSIHMSRARMLSGLATALHKAYREAVDDK